MIIKQANLLVILVQLSYKSIKNEYYLIDWYLDPFFYWIHRQNNNNYLWYFSKLVRSDGLKDNNHCSILILKKKRFDCWSNLFQLNFNMFYTDRRLY